MSEERLDAVSEALARMIRRQERIETRLDRIEHALSLPLDAGATKASNLVEPPAEPSAEPSAPASEIPSADSTADAQRIQDLTRFQDLTPPQDLIADARPPEAERPAVPPPLPDYVLAPAPVPVDPTLETTLGLNWLNRIAVVTLVIGVAFFFKYAVDNQWIGPGMRVALGVAAGMAALSLGEWMSMRGQKVFARGMTGLGLGLLYLSFYASFGFYHLLPQSAAFLLMALTTAAACGLAFHYASPAVAILGLIGGYLTPALLSTGEDHPWTLFGYLFLLNAGALVMARVRKWRALEYIAFFATALFYAGWADRWLGEETRLVATVAALAFYIQFVAGGTRGLSQVGQGLAAIGMLRIWPAPSIAFPLLWSVALSGLAVADWRKWRESPTVTAASFWIPVWVFWRSQTWNEQAGLVYVWFTLGFAVLYLWVPWWIHQRKQEARSSELWLLAANGAAYFAASYTLLNGAYHGYMGALAAALAILHAVLAKILWKTGEGEDAYPGRLSIAIAAVLLTLAIPIQFSGFRITIAWALEAAACAWLARKMANERLAFGAEALLLFVFVRLFAGDSQVYAGRFFNPRLLAFAVSAASYWIAARCLKVREAKAIVYCSGHAILLWGLCLEIRGWAGRNASDVASATTTGISILLTVYAIGLIGAGAATRTAINRLLGLALIAIVIVKLYLIDVWQLSRGFRIVAFLGLGVMLLLVSYLYSRFKPAIEKLWKEPAAETEPLPRSE